MILQKVNMKTNSVKYNFVLKQYLIFLIQFEVKVHVLQVKVEFSKAIFLMTVLNVTESLK